MVSYRKYVLKLKRHVVIAPTVVSLSIRDLGVLVFVEGGKPGNPEKNPRSMEEKQPQTQPTYDVSTESALTTTPSLLPRERKPSNSYAAQECYIVSKCLKLAVILFLFKNHMGPKSFKQRNI